MSCANGKRVLFVLNAYGLISGAEQVLLDYLDSEPLIEPYILLIGNSEEVCRFYIDKLGNDKVSFVRCDYKLDDILSRIILMPMKCAFLMRELRKNEIIRQINLEDNYDVVYFNNSFEASVFIDLFPKKRKVTHIHDMVNMFRPAHKTQVLRACKKSDIVITVSHAAKNQLVENGVSADSINVVHNGMAFERHPYSMKKEGLAIRLGFVGSTIKRKGVDTLVEIVNAFYHAKNQKHTCKVELVIATNSSLETDYFKKSIGKLNNSIRLTTYQNLNRRDVLNLYRTLDALLVPSRFDPLPTVVLEAQLQGTPVFGTRKDGIPEMILSDNMMFELENIGEAVQRLLDWFELPQNERKKYIEGVQEHIINHFSPEGKRDQLRRILEIKE